MKTQSADTSPEAERVQVALLRAASAERRLQLAYELSLMVIEMAWGAIRRLSPGVSERDARLRWIALTYGAPLAEELRSHATGRPLVNMPPNVRAALLPVIVALDELGVPYYIGGSVASSRLGIPRSTLDVDLVAELRTDQVAPFIQRLGPDYYVSEDAVREAIARRSSFNAIHQPTMVKVDIFLRKSRPYDAEALSRSTFAPDAEEPERTLAWASPEDIVLAKLEWYRLGGETSDRQWGDVLGVLKVQASALDFSYLQRWAGELGVADLLLRALDDAGLDAGLDPSAPPPTL
jgi:hypothetical protein